MTWVGMDVHARSTPGAALASLTGELQRVRFVPGTGEVVEWLAGLPGSVRAVYEAGPTRFGLARAAGRAGIEVTIAAPSKTPRARGDRVKTDRKDAELLARLPLAGQLKAVAMPAEWLEAIRHLARVREHVRRDPARNRQRVFELLLVEGLVYPGTTTRNREHRRWIADQPFEHPATELALMDLLGAVDGLTARRDALDERLSRLAQDPRLWPTVARLRAFRGVDTLSAWPCISSSAATGSASARRPRWCPGWAWSRRRAIRRVLDVGLDQQTGSSIARRLLVEAAWHLRRPDRPEVARPPGWPTRPRAADRQPRPTPTASHRPTATPARQARQCRHRRRGPRTGRLPLGRRHRTMT